MNLKERALSPTMIDLTDFQLREGILKVISNQQSKSNYPDTIS